MPIYRHSIIFSRYIADPYIDTRGEYSLLYQEKPYLQTKPISVDFKREKRMLGETTNFLFLIPTFSGLTQEMGWGPLHH